MQDMDALMKESYDDFRQVAGNLSKDELYRLLARLNVKYLISLQELHSAGITQIGSFPEHSSWVSSIDHATPRAYLVATATYETEPRKIIERLADGKFDPSREVILNESIQLKPDKDLIGQAKVLSYAGTKIGLDVSLNRDGILVLADSFYPGWKVYVDGVEKKIMRANYFFRGVLLPPGSHQVIFKYEPASFRYGLSITLLTVMVFLLLLGIWPVRRITGAGSG